MGAWDRGGTSVAERLEMAMCGRFETIGRGNVTVCVHGIGGGTLQRSRTPINGDVWEDGLNEKRVVITRKIGMICKGKMVLIKYNLNGKL